MPSKRSRAWKRRKLEATAAEEAALRLRGFDPDAMRLAQASPTGRWASSKPNMQNLPRSRDSVDALAYALQQLRRELKKP